MILFFDDNNLEAVTNVKREYEHPEYVQGSFYRDPSDYAINAGLPSVFFDEDRKEYLMLYNILEEGGNLEIYLCAAHSADGIHFEPLDTTDVKMENRRLFNQAFHLTSGEGWVYKDERAEKSARYKLFYCRYAGNLRVSDELYFSPDCLNWEKQEVTWNVEGAEPGIGCAYSRALDRYIITCRPTWAERRVCVTTTADWKTFTPLELELQTDSADEFLSHAYAMPIFEYDNYILGLFWKFLRIDEGTKAVDGQLVDLGGKMYPELSYSFGGSRFMRSLRKPFIENGSPDKPYYGNIFASTMLKAGDKIVFYAACSSNEHGLFRKKGVGSICAFSLPLDRFIYLESNGPAKFHTYSLLINGAISVNADIAEKLRFQLTDFDGNPVPGFTFAECDAIKGNFLDKALTWNGKTTEELKGKAYKLEAELCGGRIYALKGDFTVLSFNQARQYNTYGIIPTRKGF